MEEIPLPSLHNNGAQDPDRWAPSTSNRRDSYGCTHPEAGDLVAWRYAAWLVHEIRSYLDVDLTDKQREKLDASVANLTGEKRALALSRNRPFHIVLRHQAGPLIIKSGEERGFIRLHDGTREVSFTSWPRQTQWHRLPDPYQACSCHGHPWPCQDRDRMVLTQHQMRKMDRLMATAQPGVCAHCLEPITTRQKTVTFPEESRFVPGAPGPTFHAGRAASWQGAEEYERAGRLVDNPDVPRLASCPGIRFIHEQHSMPTEQRVECTAGAFCTGLHGPAGYRQDAPCWHRVVLAGNEGAYARPSVDCGYRARGTCLGGDLSGGGASLSPTAADLLWENKARRGGGLL
ncbi:hypothetical protein AB0K35_28215 [Micromonospora sp. NPDC053740]|uniref:hypothetical protein n=1 Tax=Micromonospora sp. NPDC053740 TaxID=3155173 RepID=UPI003449A552